MTVQVEVSSAQLQGSRHEQQDRLITRYAEDGSLIAVVADGIGGQPLGEWASTVAASAAAESLVKGLAARVNTVRTTFQRAFGAANRAVDQLPAQKWDPPGSTLICGLFRPMTSAVLIGSLGDSLVFRRRAGEFALLNKGYRTLYHVIGTNYRNAVSLFVHEDVMQPGDVYLLASDGVDGVAFLEILAQATLLDSARHCTEAVIKAVIEAGYAGQDNASLVAVRAFIK